MIKYSGAVTNNTSQRVIYNDNNAIQLCFTVRDTVYLTKDLQ